MSNCRISGPSVHALGLLGEIAYVQGDDATAAAASLESLALARSLGLKTIAARLLCTLGHMACGQGDIHRAAEHFAESLTLFHISRSEKGIASSLAGFGIVAQAEGQPERAARLFGAVDALLSVTDATLTPVDQTAYERGIAAARAKLDSQAFSAAWADGRALTVEQTIKDFATRHLH